MDLTLPLQPTGGVLAMLAEFERNIGDGTWQPGARLPTERDLEKRFGIARNTLRKALKRLEAEGRIVRHVGRGSFVAPLQAVPAGMDDRGLLRRLCGASPAEVMEVRLILEPRAAELAAARASADDLHGMENCLLQSEQLTELQAFEHWDGMLHLGIVSAAKNALLAELYAAVANVRNQPEWTKLKQRSLTPARREIYRAQHREIVGALRERDAESARRRLLEHLLMVQSNLLAG